MTQPPTAEDNIRAAGVMFDEFMRRESAETFRILDEQVSFDTRGLGAPESQRVHLGHDEVRAFWRSWLAAWGRIEVVAGPHFRAHGNQVVTSWRQRNFGKGSGMGIDQDAAWLWTFQNGRVVHAAFFPGRDEAFRAAGLEPGG